MEPSHLKLFNPHGNSIHESAGAPEEKPTVQYTRVIGEARVAVSVNDLLPLLADAWQSKRAWLHDFANDRVIVSQDLYEVVLAYKRLKHSSAA